jgi:hypothetical protein
MPGFNGTGPFGTGPRGRGLGPCGGGLNSVRGGRSPRLGMGFGRRWVAWGTTQSPALSPEEEKIILDRQESFLRQNMEDISKRRQELEEKSKE